jgi:hypothetical protein
MNADIGIPAGNTVEKPNAQPGLMGHTNETPILRIARISDHWLRRPVIAQTPLEKHARLINTAVLRSETRIQ